MAEGWRPPSGWTDLVLYTDDTCFRCKRRLQAGEHALGRSRVVRCVDIDDCAQVEAWGGEPVFRSKHTRIARQRDMFAGRT